MSWAMHPIDPILKKVEEKVRSWGEFGPYMYKLFIIQAGVDMCYGFRDELSNNLASAIRESFSKI